MLIEYDNQLTTKIFGDFNLMKKKLGMDRARATKRRLDQLRASINFSVYLTTGLGRPHPLSGNLKGYYGVYLTGNVRLIVKPNVKSLEPEALRECDTVIIKGVMDYHGRKNEWLIP